MWSNLKFEHLFAFAMVFCLLVSLVGAFIIGDINLITMIIGGFISSMGGILSFFFTKSNPNKTDDTPKGP